MLILEKIKEICFKIATLFGLGKKPFAVFMATAISILIVFGYRIIATIIPGIYLHYALVSLFLLYLIITFLALHFITEQDKSTIVINKMVGMLFVFYSIDFKIKFIITGFVLFHLLSFFKETICFKVCRCRLENIPFNLGTFFGYIIFGITSNLFLQFLNWLAR
jgi:phosphatidylglycerophosphatase A